MQPQQRSEQEKVQDANAFHFQVRSLIAAKIPVCLEPQFIKASAESIDILTARFHAHLSNQKNLESFLSDCSLPATYRIALNEWLHGSKSDALERLTAGSEGQRFYQKAVGFVLLQAMLILGIVFLGTVCVCIWLVPIMEHMQTDSFADPGPGLKTLGWIRGSLPYWGPMLFVLVGAILLFHRRILSSFQSKWYPMQFDSYALTEFQSLFARPARFQWLVSIVVVLCGICVLLQALSVFGVTIEILTQLINS